MLSGNRTPAVLLLVAVLLFAAAPANAGLEIRTIRFNPHGRDTGTKHHLNKERIVITNTGKRTRSLDGFHLFNRGERDSYRFGDVELGSGDLIYLMTGRGPDLTLVCVDTDCPVRYHLHWNLDHYVWDNGGDRATLTRRWGKVIDRCAYTASADSPIKC